MIPTFDFPGSDLRAGLPLIGQIASPIQCLWVLAHLFEALQAAGLIDSGEVLVKENCHEQLLRQLQQIRFHHWCLDSMTIMRTLSLRTAEHALVQIALKEPTKVKELLHAHAELLGWGSRSYLKHDGLRLHDDFWLHPLTYDLVEWTPNTLRPSPTQPCIISFTTENNGYNCSVPAGSFVLPLLREHGLSVRHLDYETQLCPGDRLWGDLALKIRGAGASELAGLSAKDIEQEAEILMEQAPPHHCLLPMQWTADLASKPKAVVGFQIRHYLNKLFEMGNAPAKVFMVLCIDKHWVLFEYDALEHQSKFYDGIALHSSWKHFLAETFANIYAQPLNLFPDNSLLCQREDDICGIIALVNLGWCLGLWQNFHYHDAVNWARSLQHGEHLHGLGNKDYGSTIAWLTQFLPSRGVPEEKAAERSADAVKKLGLNAVVKAIQSDNPWKQLKMLGSNATKPYLWVQHDELKDHIARRAGQKFGAAGPPKKPKRARNTDDKTKQVQIPPEQLTIPPGIFIDDKQAALPFISLDSIKADCRGVTIADVEHAACFLQDSKKLSLDALGMLTTAEIPSPVVGSLVVENVTWPALYGEEALLIKGSLIQLGDIRASIKTGTSAPQASIQTMLLRFQLYRDQTSLDWAQFTKGPMKMLIQNLMPLQLCSSQGCGVQCGRYHPVVGETADMVILDCFAWKWYNEKGVQVATYNSTSFSVMVRTLESAVDGIMKIAGKDGFYPEIRDQPGQPSKFAVIWLKTDHAGALHALQTNQHAIHLARLQDKYGLCCLRKNEALLRKIVYPNQTFVDCEVKHLFEVGPWDYGIQKSVVQESFAEISWKARVLKPSRGGAEGRFWIVGAEEAPSCPVFPFGQTQITITKVKDMVPAKQSGNVVASLRTIQKLQTAHATSSKVDPWLTHDPWSRSWNNWTPSSASTSMAAPSSRFDEIEAHLRDAVTKEVEAKIAAFPMDVEDDPKFSQMQVDITELREQHRQFSGWFNEVSGKFQGMENTIQQQGAAIDLLNSQMVGQQEATSQLQTSVGGLEHALKTEMHNTRLWQQQAIEDQTQKLEALLSKRARNE